MFYRFETENPSGQILYYRDMPNSQAYMSPSRAGVLNEVKS